MPQPGPGPDTAPVPRLLVDARTLLAVREKLGRLHDQLLRMHTVVDGYEGLLGGRALESELRDFCTRWHFGTIEVAEEISALMNDLLGAVSAYQRIEERLAAAHARPSGSGTTTVGGRGPATSVIRTGPYSGHGTTTIG